MDFTQRSIQKTRLLFTELNRQIAAVLKRKRADEQKLLSQLELDVDSICYELGIPCTEKNLPTIATYVERLMADRAKAAAVEPEPESDFKDFPI